MWDLMGSGYWILVRMAQFSILTLYLGSSPAVWTHLPITYTYTSNTSFFQVLNKLCIKNFLIPVSLFSICGGKIGKIVMCACQGPGYLKVVPPSRPCVHPPGPRFFLTTLHLRVVSFLIKKNYTHVIGHALSRPIVLSNIWQDFFLFEARDPKDPVAEN